MRKLVMNIIEQIGSPLVNPPRYDQQGEHSCHCHYANEYYTEKGVLKPKGKPGRGQKCKQLARTRNNEQKPKISLQPPADKAGIQHSFQEFFIGESLVYRYGVLHNTC